MQSRWLLCVCVAALALTANALFTDEAGVVDWMQAQVGEVIAAETHPAFAKSVFVLTSEGVFASINTRTGALQWRVVLPDGPGGQLLVASGQREVRQAVVVSGDGLRVRGFELAGGRQVWSHTSPADDAVMAACLVVKSKGATVDTSAASLLLASGTLMQVSLKRGTVVSTVKVPGVTAGPASVFAASVVDATAVHVAVVPAGHGQPITVVRASRAKLMEGKAKFGKSRKTVAVGGTSRLVAFASPSLLAIVDADAHTLWTADLDGGKPQVEAVPQTTDVLPGTTFAHGPVAGAVAVATARGIVRIAGDAEAATYPLAGAPSSVVMGGAASAGMVVAADADGRLVRFDASAPLVASAQTTVEAHPVEGHVWAHHAGPKRVFPLVFPRAGAAGAAASAGVVRVLCVTQGGALVMVKLSSGATAWVRHEELAGAARVVFADLPGGDMAALAEVHAALAIPAHDGAPAPGSSVPLVGALVRRIRFQLAHLDETVANIRDNLAAVFAPFLGDAADAHSPAKPEALPNTRDRFNFYQAAVISTDSGVLTALHTGDGHPLWSLRVPGAAGAPHLHLAPHHSLLTAVVPTATGTVQACVVDVVAGTLAGCRALPGVASVSHLTTGPDGALFVVDTLMAAHVIDDASGAQAALGDAQYAFTADALAGKLHGFRVQSGDAARDAVAPQWTIDFAPGEEIAGIATPSPAQVLGTPATLLSEERVIYKYLNPNMAAVVTTDDAPLSVHLYVIDTVSGAVILHQVQEEATGPVAVHVADNKVLYHYWSEADTRFQLTVVDLYEPSFMDHSAPASANVTMSSWKMPAPTTYSQTFLLPLGVSAIGSTATKHGITNRQFLFATRDSAGVYTMDAAWLDARRSKNPAAVATHRVPVYEPWLPVPHTSIANYHQPLYGISDIVSAPCDLESHSLVIAFGFDVFFTRVVPSGLFDMLANDFMFAGLFIIMCVLPAAILVVRHLSHKKTLASQWK